MVDLSTLADLGVAAGTGVLALLTYLTIRQNRHHLLTLSEQNALLRAHQNPILALTQFRFVGNEVELTISNLGNSAAVELVLGTSFVPSHRVILDASGSRISLTTDQIKKALEAKQQLFENYELFTGELKHEDEKAFQAKAVVYLLNSQRAKTVLTPGSIHMFRVEPLFELKTENGFQVLKFGDLEKILRSNGLSSAALEFWVEGKDTTQNMIPGQTLKQFILDFKKHKTLEEAAAAGVRPYFMPISLDEMVENNGWLDYELYKGVRSGLNARRPWEKDSV